ncbi:hypothetical protein AgCh_030933 [Apium graveolens]
MNNQFGDSLDVNYESVDLGVGQCMRTKMPSMIESLMFTLIPIRDTGFKEVMSRWLLYVSTRIVHFIAELGIERSIRGGKYPVLDDVNETSDEEDEQGTDSVVVHGQQYFPRAPWFTGKEYIEVVVNNQFGSSLAFNHKSVDLDVGQMYADKDAFADKVHLVHINSNRRYNILRSNLEQLVVICVHRNCPVYCRAGYRKKHLRWEISRNRVNYYKVGRGKQLAVEKVYGKWSTIYGELLKFMGCLKALIEEWKYVRLVISEDNWAWFLRLLRQNVRKGRMGVCIISDSTTEIHVAMRNPDNGFVAPYGIHRKHDVYIKRIGKISPLGLDYLATTKIIEGINENVRMTLFLPVTAMMEYLFYKTTRAAINTERNRVVTAMEEN